MTLDVDSKIKRLGSFDKEWANWILKDGIRELKNTKRVKVARFSEILNDISLLKNEGFWWQARILRYQLHRHLDLLQSARARSDSLDQRERERCSQ